MRYFKDDLMDVRNWRYLTPMLVAFRYPFHGDKDQLPKHVNVGTHSELITACRGSTFSWGDGLRPNPLNNLWKHFIGFGGQSHTGWYVTNDGLRYSGAPNAPEEGFLRHSLYVDGGYSGNGPETSLQDNEGFFLVQRLPVGHSEYEFCREVFDYIASYISADGGNIIFSPKDTKGVSYVGFVGRCLMCPRPETQSIKTLQTKLSHHQFELLPEWKNWRICY